MALNPRCNLVSMSIQTLSAISSTSMLGTMPGSVGVRNLWRLSQFGHWRFFVLDGVVLECDSAVSFNISPQRGWWRKLIPTYMMSTKGAPIKIHTRFALLFMQLSSKARHRRRAPLCRRRYQFSCGHQP